MEEVNPDELIFCKICEHKFSLDKAMYSERLPNYAGIIEVGVQCPECKNRNVAYYTNPKLQASALKLKTLSGKLRTNAKKKYQREFLRFQDKAKKLATKG